MMKESAKKPTTVRWEYVHEAPAVQHDAMPVGSLAVQNEGHLAGGEVCDRHGVPTEDQEGRDDHCALQPQPQTKLMILKALLKFKMWGEMMCSRLMCQAKLMVLTVLSKFKM